ncbi:hypothetical protein Q5P01_005916 [Channa striata]|uniref:Uncharacterized protein n=1 Tax=Channa striata TaxID=64152 RepID=A0AA88NH32_CHASR|nr:hypothetical protein Q5P01_005916 [Channa striata]
MQEAVGRVFLHICLFPRSTSFCSCLSLSELLFCNKRWSKGEEEEEEEEEEDEEEDKDDDEGVEEDEERNDSSSETEVADKLMEKPTEKPEELSEEPEPEGELRAAAEISNEPVTAAEEKPDVSCKPANGAAHSSKSQSGPGKKLSLFGRLSSSRSKQTRGTDQTPAGGTDSGNAAAQGEPAPSAAGGNNNPEANRASQRSRSGACTLL